MGCGMSMVKYILFLFNLLCAICGILIIAFGALMFTNINSFSDLSTAFITQGFPVALIILGSAILIISFFGCCGAIRESSCMSMTYAALLLVLLVIQVGLIVVAYINKDEFIREVGKMVDTAWEKRDKTTTLIETLQSTYQCCGKNFPTDWGSLTQLPKSCCNLNQESCTLINAYKTGCKQAVRSWWEGNWDLIKYVGIGIAAVEIAGILIVIFSGAIIAETSETYNIKDADSSVVLGICLLVLGAAITIVAFFGCCGAMKESICMSVTYMLLLGILFILQIIFILVIALGKDNFVESMKGVLVEGFKNRNKHPELINGIQTSMKCCGVEGPTDYHAFANTGFYPDSCCSQELKQQDANFKCSSNDVYANGCLNGFQQHCTDILNTMLWSSVAVAAIELAGILSACCLVVNIRNDKRRSAY